MDDPNLGANTPVNRGNAGKGRPKGSVNKSTAQIKDALMAALQSAGDAVGDVYGLEGPAGYMHMLAMNHPSVYSTLIGKILPTQLTGDEDAPLNVIHKIERVIIDPRAD